MTRSEDFDPFATPVADRFERWRASGEELSRARKAVAEREARQELVAFQLAELDRAAIASGDEDAELAATRQVLANAERVERLCEESYASLYESDGAVLSSLGHVWRRVADLAAIDPRFQLYLDARDGIKSQLEDLALFLRRYADGIEASPARLQQVEERLALLERLKRKYGPTLAECIARRDALRRELADLESGDQRIAELTSAHAAAREAYLTAARALAAERRRVAVPFAAGHGGAGRRSWRWNGRGSRCGSASRWRRRPGRRAASTRPSSSCRRTPARNCGRWRASFRRRAVAPDAGDQDVDGDLAPRLDRRRRIVRRAASRRG